MNRHKNYSEMGIEPTGELGETIKQRKERHKTQLKSMIDEYPNNPVLMTDGIQEIVTLLREIYNERNKR